MADDTAQRFGVYIKGLREQQNLSIRGLARKAQINSGVLTRLEHGKITRPQPSTLKVLAEALQVPLADMFATVNYVIPHDLPSLAPYLQAKYCYLPQETLTAANDYLEQLIQEAGQEAQ